MFPAGNYANATAENLFFCLRAEGGSSWSRGRCLSVGPPSPLSPGPRCVSGPPGSGFSLTAAVDHRKITVFLFSVHLETNTFKNYVLDLSHCRAAITKRHADLCSPLALRQLHRQWQPLFHWACSPSRPLPSTTGIFVETYPDIRRPLLVFDCVEFLIFI
ncbi:unnamed protein product [Pleuronectes platessa]|uniref:Uncharacterized protein n=1 Tax=Pleuronectes platessa TaxID=8262 RepID=A0A9N7VKV5_PLEPL|nr:unnamed protein product [Pleuronectes platessa]